MGVFIYSEMSKSVTQREWEQVYEESLIYTVETDALGNYYFANLDLTDGNTYYEVMVSSPNSYAHCTTNNQIISNIETVKWTNTIVTPEMMPGTDSGNTTLRNTWKPLQPKS